MNAVPNTWARVTKDEGEHYKVSFAFVWESDDTTLDRFITFTPMRGSTDKTVELFIGLYSAVMNGDTVTTHLCIPLEKHKTAWREDRDRGVLQQPLHAYAKRREPCLICLPSTRP